MVEAAAGAGAAGAGAAGAGAAGAGAAGAGAAGAGANGAGAPAWYEAKEYGFDDDSKRFIAGKNFPDAKTAMRSHMEADKLARERNVLERPAPDKLNEGKGWSELGWIEDAGKYLLKQPEKLPPGITYSGDFFDMMRKAAHDARVPLPAAQKIHDATWAYMLECATKLNAADAKAKADLDGALHNEWGGDYNHKSGVARRAMAAFNPDPSDTALIGRLMGEPALVKMFASIGERIGEASFPADGGGAGVPGMPSTIAATEAEINRMHGDEAFRKVLDDQRHPQHGDYVAQRQRLIKHLTMLRQRAGITI